MFARCAVEGWIVWVAWRDGLSQDSQAVVAHHRALSFFLRILVSLGCLNSALNDAMVRMFVEASVCVDVCFGVGVGAGVCAVEGWIVTGQSNRGCASP